MLAFGTMQANNVVCRNKQFAVVENPGLWNWTFTLKDINGEVLAQIDRDWRGFGFEVVSFLCDGEIVIDSCAFFSSFLACRKFFW